VFDKGFRWVTDPSVQAEDKPDSPKEPPEQESPPEAAPKQAAAQQASGPTNQGTVSAWRPSKNNDTAISFVDSLIASAVNDGASDIHIEPREKELHVRLRIDGVLFNKPAPRIKMHPAIISRLKILANLDISERRLPQDGRIRASVGGEQVDLRISMLPISHGEKCVIRVLDSRAISVGLEQLGMAADTLEAFHSQILQPHGIVLVTGPTGSGKSTTLYSALQVMDGGTLNICTVEDPVEYDLASINQVQVHENIGMTFAVALRSLLRQDPDTIMGG